jgi:uncharacterized protein with von Willebrand factor type A (vWA) domain
MFKMLETTKGKMFLKEANVETPLEYMSSKLKGSEGGTNLVKAMREVIKAMQNDKQTMGPRLPYEITNKGQFDAARQW